MTAWHETRILHVALRDAKKNGRVGKLFSVLRDGEPRTRREIFERVGFMLTNNAASELRRELKPQGYGVAQWCVVENGERTYCYQIVSLSQPPLTSAEFGEPKHAWNNGDAGRGGYESEVHPHPSEAVPSCPPAASEGQLALPLPGAALKSERAA